MNTIKNWKFYLPISFILITIIIFGQARGEFFGIRSAFGYGGGGIVGGGLSSPPSSISNFNIPLTISPIQSGTYTQNMTNDKKVVLDVPKGSTVTETTFKIKEEALTITDTPKPAVKAELLGGTTFSVTAKDNTGKSVTSFSKSLIISITIPALPADITDIGLYYLNTSQRLWILIADAEFADDVVTFSVEHLTEFAIFQVPGLPATLPISSVISDTNTDEKVDILDFNALMVHWGSTDKGNVADFNADAAVDIFDFNLLMINWTG